MTVIYRHNQERRAPGCPVATFAEGKSADPDSERRPTTMITLYKFYELINRNAMVTLTNTKLDTTYFEGSTKDIPDCYDDWKVPDFSAFNDGDFLFRIEQ